MDGEFDWKKISFENANSLSKLTILVEQTSRDVSRLAKHEAKIDRLITQNGEIKETIGVIKERVEEDKKKLRVVYFMANHPKVSLALFVSAWALTFYEVRNAVIIHLKPIVDLIVFIKGGSS